MQPSQKKTPSGSPRRALLSLSKNPCPENGKLLPTKIHSCCVIAWTFTEKGRTLVCYFVFVLKCVRCLHFGSLKSLYLGQLFICLENWELPRSQVDKDDLLTNGFCTTQNVRMAMNHRSVKPYVGGTRRSNSLFPFADKIATIHDKISKDVLL